MSPKVIVILCVFLWCCSTGGAQETFEDFNGLLEANQNTMLENLKELATQMNATREELAITREELAITREGLANQMNATREGLMQEIKSLRSNLESSQESTSLDIKAKIVEATKKIKGLLGKTYCNTEGSDAFSRINRCYLFTYFVNDWNFANTYCGQHGGYLVLISNDAELKFIKEHAKEDHWIGMTYDQRQESYKWSMYGRPHNIEDHLNWWGESELNDEGSGEACIEFNHSTKKLNEADCNIKKSYICEFDSYTDYY